MSIRIHSISVNGLGPIASFRHQFKDINLIFGRNEQGKTFLVEYLLRSLFRNSPKTRTLTDSGQVLISGLTASNLRFDPKSRKKLEDYLFTDADERSVDLSRLCVVKGGKTSFTTDQTSPVSKDILKDYLSDQRILDAILSNIPSTIQTCTWENGEIVPARQTGEWKKYMGLVKGLNNSDTLLQEVDHVYRKGEISKEKLELEKLNQSIEQQENARRFYAYQLSEKIKEKQAELQLIPANELEKVKQLNFQVDNLRTQIESDRIEIQQLESKVIHYSWLETAIAECEKRPKTFIGRLGWFYVITAILLTAAAIIFAFLEMPYGSLASGLAAIIFVILSILYYQTKLKNSGDDAEVARIFTEFETKFRTKANSIADIKSNYNNLTPQYFRSITLRENLIKSNQERTNLLKDLNSRLARLYKELSNSESPETVIAKLDIKRSQLDSQLNTLSMELARTGISENNYIAEPIDLQYDPGKLDAYEKRSMALNQSILEKERDLENLKQRICDVTGSQISIDWNELIDALRNNRDETSQALKAIKAQIGSGIILTEVINQKRAKEDENIATALALPTICTPLEALTHTYQGVEIEGNRIIVNSEHQRFPIEELSTGAQEQVLLALRIGIASYLLKDQPMFLILDDAFQHSDWQRREWLVDEMAELANLGWQIIYFSMDDHIKGLFEKRIKPKFGDRFALFELNNKAF